MGRVEIPARKGIPKAPLWCQKLIRGVCSYIVDILVEGPGVWGEGPVLDSPVVAAGGQLIERARSTPASVAVAKACQPAPCSFIPLLHEYFCRKHIQVLVQQVLVS